MGDNGLALVASSRYPRPSYEQEAGIMASTKFVFSSFAAAMAIIGAANAQDYIAQCRESAVGDAERIECLENAIRALQGDGLAAVPAETSVAEVEDLDAPSGLGAEQVAARQDRKKPKEEKKKEKEDNTVTVGLRDFAVAANGEYILFLANGQVWRQKAKANARVRLFPGKDYTITVKKGALSGYRATINEARRTFVVERIK